MVTEARNWVREGCDTVGTGPLSLTGAASGKASFAQAFGSDPKVVPYVVRDKTTQYIEAGKGTFNGVNSITRDTPRAILANGVYSRGSPLPINLEGDSEVYCAMTEGLFDELLQKDEASSTYVPLITELNLITGSQVLGLHSPLVTVLNEPGVPYSETSDPDSVLTIGNLPKLARNVATPTVNYTLTIDDSNSVVLFRVQTVDPLVLYVPTNASVPFPVGTQISVINMGWGTVTVSPVSTVNLFPTLGYNTVIPAIPVTNNSNRVVLTYVGVDDWTVNGDLTPTGAE